MSDFRHPSVMGTDHGDLAEEPWTKSLQIIAHPVGWRVAGGKHALFAGENETHDTVMSPANIDPTTVRVVWGAKPLKLDLDALRRIGYLAMDLMRRAFE